jgi:hypothetical protein
MGLDQEDLDKTPYRGSPNVEAYYLAQPLEVRRLSRSQLAEQYPALYRKLSRAGKISLVPRLPHARAGHTRPLDRLEVEKIVSLTSRGFGPSLVARILGHDRKTVKKYAPH